MKSSIKYLLAITSFAMCTGLAQADGEKCDSPLHNQTNASNQADEFKRVDSNGDNLISKSEYNAYNEKNNAKHFKQLDVNKDGKLSQQELSGVSKPEMASSNGTTHLDKRFYAADVNHDGGLDKAEAINMPMLTAYFDQVDSNHDGSVTRQEYFDAMPLLHRGKQIDASGKAQTL